MAHKDRETVFNYLMGFGFRAETLHMLNDKNLEILAAQYNFQK